MHWAFPSDIYLFGFMLILFVILILHICQKKTSFSEEGFQSSPPEAPYATSLSCKDIQGLKGGQRIMTEMLRVFDQICRRHDIRYWCTGGTLIGAVRHQGWIPWDGDIDVGMIYEDYPKFLKAIDDELPSSMWLQTTKTDPHYPKRQFNRYLPKIRHLYSCYQNCQDGVMFHNGFMLDIFLYDIQKSNLVPLTGDMTDIRPYSMEMIFPLAETLFEGIRVYIPHQYKEYCELNWKTYPPPYPPRDQRYPHEGTLDPNAICDHHYKLYPHLYAST